MEADGASRGNPGHASYGTVIRNANTGEVVAERAAVLGHATNNVAEYSGLVAGLTAIAELDPEALVEVRMDSKLVVEQMSGRWKIKSPDMQKLAIEAREILPYGNVTYTWIPREDNKHADALANEALDTHLAGGSGIISRPQRTLMTMILLPPSEGKTDATGKQKLDFKKLSFPELTKQRQELVNAVISMANGPAAKTRTALAISAKQDFEIERDQQLLIAPTGPAWSVYTGVLYEAIEIDSLSAKAKSKFEAENFVVSALFGLINVSDRIPAYRLSGDTVVPKIGSLTKFWSESISELIADQGQFVVDLRSGNYVKLGPIDKEIADQVVVPRIMQKMPKGAPKVVSHSNKATKGRLVRALAQSAKTVNSVQQLANLAEKVAIDVKIIKPTKAGVPWGLDVIVEVL